jgi:hypothetical protein
MTLGKGYLILQVDRRESEVEPGVVPASSLAMRRWSFFVRVRVSVASNLD